MTDSSEVARLFEIAAGERAAWVQLRECLAGLELVQSARQQLAGMASEDLRAGLRRYRQPRL